MVKEMFPNCYPVSQLANIGGEESRKPLFRWNILIHCLFYFYSPEKWVYPQHPRIYPQICNYFPKLKAFIHNPGSKIKSCFYLASSVNHQYGLSGVFPGNQWEKNSGKGGGVRLLEKGEMLWFTKIQDEQGFQPA